VSRASVEKKEARNMIGQTEDEMFSLTKGNSQLEKLGKAMVNWKKYRTCDSVVYQWVLMILTKQ
jgi:hypothetical protein